jgi:serine/threonine-protein kinase RsbW
LVRPISRKNIFASGDVSDLVGRAGELARLIAHAHDEGSPNGLAVMAGPSADASELFRHAYDRLFFEQQDVIPFYFAFRESDRDAHGAATRFLREFLMQTVAFRRRDPNIIDASPEVDEIAELAPPADGHWIDRMIETCASGGKLSDDHSLVRNCLSAPMRAQAGGARSFVMIDNVHLAEYLFEDLRDIFSRSNVRFVFGGPRRFLFARTDLATMPLDSLSVADAGQLVERLAEKTQVAINDQTRDLIAVQLGGNASHIASLFVAANGRQAALDSFERVESLYTDEIFGGRIARSYDEMLGRALPNGTERILRLLSETINGEASVPVSYWKKHAHLDDAAFDAALGWLNIHEIVSIGSGAVRIDPSDLPFADYVRARVRLEIDGEPRALAVGSSLADNIARAPQLMARFYRNGSALKVRDLIQAFDGQQISPALIQYDRFKAEYKGLDDGKILTAAREDKEKRALPQIVFTTYTAAIYPPLDEVCERDRSAVGLGFSDPEEKDEVAWIAAEIDSKLEATRETAEFWCNRLEMAAVHCNFKNYRLWLIAPEGFSDEALAALRKRNAYGSSHKQATLLATLLKADSAPVAAEASSEYEITVPMGEDTELIAAHTVEDIARRHNFPPKAINQIKTALVEALINAAEHGHSPDRKVHQKFVVTDDKIVITAQNRGLRLSDQVFTRDEPDEGRRGWGLKLMRGLMDDVRIERADDGTRITMTKSLNPH